MTESIISTTNAPALAAYPHARRAGDLIFVSGVSCRRSDGTHEGVGDIDVQTRAVLRNIDAILKTAGASLAEVVDITVFLVDMADYSGMNTAYNDHFDSSSGPSRTTVAVRELPHPNLLVEMKAVAYVGD